MKGEDAQLLVIAAEMDKAGDRRRKEKRGARRGEGRRGEERHGEVRRAVKEVGKRVGEEGIGGLDKGLLTVLEAPESVN